MLDGVPAAPLPGGNVNQQAVVLPDLTPQWLTPAQEQELVARWLRKHRSVHTRRAYAKALAGLLTFVGHKPLQQVTPGDLQDYAEALEAHPPRPRRKTARTSDQGFALGEPSKEQETLADASRNVQVAAIRSFFTFAQKLYPSAFPIHPGVAVSLAKPKRKLAERILSAEEVQRMIALESDPRNHALLRLLYNAALRLSEVCALRWRDLQERELQGHLAGQVTVYGKGDKTRSVILTPSVWQELCALRNGAGEEEPVFVSQKGRGPLQRSQITLIVQAAAARAEIHKPVSPHWLRHAAASHALDRGAPLSLVQSILGHENVATTGRYLHARPNTGLGEFLAL